MQKKSADDFLLVDTHVHIHDLFNLKDFFSSAYLNFEYAAGRYFNTGNYTGILCLAESYKADYFHSLIEYIKTGKNLPDLDEDWRIKPTEEDYSLIVQKNGKIFLIIIAGSQIITNENLEVLALGTQKKFRDGSNLKDTIQKILAENAIPVLPWGVGKWTGKRGSLIRSFIEENHGLKFFLGDNSGRPYLSPEPKIFESAVRKGIKVLRGSDPLPFKSQEKKAGSFGIGIQGKIDSMRPGADLKQILWDTEKETINFGELEYPHVFFKNQILIQLRNRIGKRFK